MNARRPTYRGARAALIGALAAASVGCAAGNEPEPRVQGRIFDDRIEMSAPAAPSNGWLELENVGSRPCSLIVADTLDETDAGLDPSDLPLRGGRVVTHTTDPAAGGIHAAEELYTEIDGQPVPVEPGLPAKVVIEPGARARVQLSLSLGAASRPRDGAVRVLICDERGDYEAGRFAVLGFAS